MEAKKEWEKEMQEEKQALEQKKEAEKQQTVYEKSMDENYFYFLMISICFGFCYVFGTYNIESGLGLFAATVGEIACCLAMVKKWKMEIKKDILFYIVMILALSVMMLWTNQIFLHFFQKRAILILFLMMLLHQLYTYQSWRLKDELYYTLTLVCNGIVSLFQPAEQFLKQLQKEKVEIKKGIYVLLGIAIAVPLVLFIGIMLSVADVVFKNMIVNLFGNLFLPKNMILILFLFLFGFWVFYCFMAGLSKMNIKTAPKQIQKAEPVIAITFTSVLLAIYILFCVIQIVYLFAGGENNLPQGYTYSSYARRGFFELLVVSVINFLMVVICNINFRKSKWLDGMLIGISVCNMILIASSAYRMLLYIGAYHLTTLRVFVLWFLAALTVSMVGVIYSIWKKEYGLFRYVFIVALVFFIAISGIKPHALVVRYNLSHMQWYSMDDLTYMMNLSYDAAPELAKIDTDKIIVESEHSGEEIMREYFENVKIYCEKRRGRAYHIGAKKAEKAAEQYLNEIVPYV